MEIKMNWEKRLAVLLSIGIGMVLVICTIASQIIYEKLLPSVEVVLAEWTKEGYVLPKEALYISLDGECVYYIEEKKERSHMKYVVKKVLVTVVEENSETVTVQGIYSPEWVYALGADSALENGMEVKIRK